MTEDEIRKMVKDAELHAEEDRKLKELTDSRNQGDALVYATRKSLEEHGAKLSQNERDRIESAIQDLDNALKGSSKSDIDSKMTALTNAAQVLGNTMPENMQSASPDKDIAAAGGGKPAVATR